MLIKITLPDGAEREYPAGTTVEQIAESISLGLKKNAVAGKLNGKLVDLAKPIKEDASIEILTLESEGGIEVLRHSNAHLMAQALRRLFGEKNVKLGVGPVIDDGFYYDVDIDIPISTEVFEEIEKEMEKIVQENLPIVRREVPRQEAVRIFTELGDPYKIELIRDLPEDSVISIYEQGEFFDLCRGPHLPSTGRIKAFKLVNVSGAYWRGDAKNKMLQRIYGTAFQNQAQLEEHLQLVEEAKKRDGCGAKL